KGGEGKFGMLDVIKEYSGTPSANLANYYAGTAYLHLKDYKKAIEHLSDFKSDDEILAPLAKGNIGDAFAQLNQSEDALDYYEQAAELRNNEYTTPMYLYKAGVIALDLGKADKALTYFNKIKEEFPNSSEAGTIDVFIGKAQVLANK
ncbi:MAG TPA: tetratricopeptide repeat protein, partial [Mariniflexile sp.]